MRDSLIKVINMEKESIITSRVNFTSETGKTMSRMVLASISMKMEPGTVESSKIIWNMETEG